MHNTRKVNDDVIYVGGDDRRISKFENILDIHSGVSYNSYIIMDEKTCLMDTIDSELTRQFLENVTYTLNGKDLDYLVIHHMECDHCYNIEEILLRYPDCTVVSNQTVFKYIGQFFPNLKIKNTLLVKEGDTLILGKHTLKFFFTPFVHWPEVMMSFDSFSNILFSADAFGKFGALNGNLFVSDLDFEKDIKEDARLYYTNIVGKYGVQVNNAFKKLPINDIKMILPLHGPIYDVELDKIISLYIKWANYDYEDKECIIIYSSMYQNNKNVADILANLLSLKGQKRIKVYDVSYTDTDLLVSESFRVSNIIVISSTYNGNIHPLIERYITAIMNMNLSKKTFSLIDNGTWANTSNKLIKERLSKNATLKFTETELSIKSTIKETDVETLEKIVDEIVA